VYWQIISLFGRPFVKRFALCCRSVVCLSCPVLSCLSVTLVYCGQTVGRIKTKLGMQIGLVPWPHCVRWGLSSPSPKGHSPHPIFCPYLLRLNGCMDQDANWYGARPQPRRLCVRWEPSPLNFRPMFNIVIVISLENCTMHSRWWFIQVQVQVLVFYAFYFSKKVWSLIVLSLFQYKYAMHSCTT